MEREKERERENAKFDCQLHAKARFEKHSRITPLLRGYAGIQ